MPLNKILDDETLSSSILYRGRIVNVRHDLVRLHGGKIAFREVVEHPGAVAILALDDQSRVILVRQYRQPAAQVMLEIPAGKLEPGENPLDCAKRELNEETGLQSGSWQELGCFYLSPGFCNEKIHIFLARDLSEAALPIASDEDETVEVISMPLTNLLKLVERGELKDAKTVISLLLVRNLTA